MDRTVNLEFLRAMARQILFPSSWIGEAPMATPANAIVNFKGLEQTTSASFDQDVRPAETSFQPASVSQVIPTPKVVRTIASSFRPTDQASARAPSRESFELTAARLGGTSTLVSPPPRAPTPSLAPTRPTVASTRPPRLSDAVIASQLSQLQQRATERRTGMQALSRIIKKPGFSESDL